MVKLKYSEISNMEFAQATNLVARTPTHGPLASKIHKVIKAISKARQAVTKEYQDVLVEKYGKRDESGKLIRPEDNPDLGFEVDEAVQPDFEKAQDEFGQKILELSIQPFADADFANFKISAHHLEAMSGLYVGNVDEEPAKPPVPVAS